MSYIGQGLPDNQFIGYETEAFSGSGSANQQLSLSKQPFSESSILVVINNVVQRPTTDYAVSGSTVTLVGTVASGDVIYVTHLGATSPIGEASALDLGGQSDKLVLDADGDTTISADTDDQIDFKAGGTDVMSMTATGLTINDGVEITTADNTDTLTLTSTDADASSGPNLRFYRNSSSPADNDSIVQIDFEGRNDNSQDVIYGQFVMSAQDVSDGTEDSVVTFSTMKAGSLVEQIGFNASETVFNNQSNEIDFRVESNGNANALIVKGANDRVGIGGGDASFGVLGVENAGDSHIDMFSNVGTGTRGKAEIFFSTDGSSDHHSCASIVMEQPSGDQAARKGQILLNVSDNGGPSTALTVANNGVVSGNLNDTSDENLKKNIEDLGASTDIIKALKPRKFDWKQTSAGSDIAGFVAQEVATVIPNAVVGNDYVATTFYEDGDALPDGYIVGDVKEAGDKGKALNTTAILAHAVKTIQELEARIKTLEDA